MNSARFIVMIVLATSFGAYVVAVRRFGLIPSSLWGATLRTTEVIGTVVLIFAFNISIGVATILILRAATGWFLSVYLLNDVSLLMLSALQALLLDFWRRPPGRDVKRIGGCPRER